MPVKDLKEWKKFERNNDEPYSKCCVIVAMEVMTELDKIEKINAEELITLANRKLKAGITGFQAGMVAQIVFSFHTRGDEFRKSWNRNYGVEEEKAKGRVVNPAIMTIDLPEKN